MRNGSDDDKQSPKLVYITYFFSFLYWKQSVTSILTIFSGSNSNKKYHQRTTFSSEKSPVVDELCKREYTKVKQVT